MKYNISEIRKILNHKYPFLLIDGVTDVVPFSECRAFKNYTFNEWFFPSHFDNEPVLPASLLLESFTQAFAIPLLVRNESTPSSNLPLIFAGVDKFRIFKPVIPGDRLEIHVYNIRNTNGIVFGHVKGHVDGDCIGSGILTYKINTNE
jgi:3-hydroxyacyl-[acyl-carrier-protein] dehydratase